MQAAAQLIDALRVAGARVTLAESCTGGMAAATITAVPGASLVLDAAYVTYSNASKTRLLGVPKELLSSEGAVSSACVRSLIQGLLHAEASAEFAGAISGVAGPGGGSEQRPVGTVYIAVGQRDREPQVRRLQLSGDRAAVRGSAVRELLTALTRAAQGAPAW